METNTDMDPNMDEDHLEAMREYIREQLMALDLNADTTDSDELPMDDTYADSDNDEEFDWYHWPDKTVVDRLDGKADLDLETASDSANGDEDADEQQQQNHQQDDKDDDAEDEGHGSVGELQEDDSSEAETKKKKKKRKKKKKNLPPADDDEYEEPIEDPAVATNPYNPISCADDRFRQAIENFRSERSFTSLSSQILSTYFSFGGMDEHPEVTGPRKDGIEFEDEIDFIYVVSAFLSSYLFMRGGWQDQVYFQKAPKIIAAFLKYLLAKKALPEYEHELNEALKVTGRAKVEAPRCCAFNEMMPDEFNQSCSIQFVQEYSYDDLPENSIEVMASVAPIGHIAGESLKGRKIGYTRVVRKEKVPSIAPGPWSLEIPEKQETSETPSASQEESLSPMSTASIDYSKVLLRGMSIEEGIKDLTEDATNLDGEEYWVYVPSGAAVHLEPGMVVWGTFFTLASGLVFARPMVALPSFYVELDDDLLDLQ